VQVINIFNILIDRHTGRKKIISLVIFISWILKSARGRGSSL